MTPPEPTEQDAQQLPKRTTPTWDMELLLSGATVFALFQAAQAVAEGGSYYLPRMQGELLMLASMLFTYGQGGLILLVLTFSLHLSLRAYWVALVGMNSVYPAGLKPDGLRLGPLARAVLEKRWRPLEDVIERADNRATIVFGIGVSAALVLVPVSLVVTLMFALAAVAGWLTGHPDASQWALLGMMGLMFLPYFVAMTVDRKYGARLVPGSLAHRACRGAIAFYARLGMTRDANPLVTVFISNIGDRRGNAVMFTVMMLALLLSTVGLVLNRHDLGMGSYQAFPDPRRGMAASVEGRGYASSHEPGWSPLTPFLPDMVVRGSYLRLVVPYVPTVHGHLLEKCPEGLAASRKTGPDRERRLVLLACFADGLEVSLDGQRVTQSPEWFTDPGRDLRGLLYMIPAAGLAPGRHEVTVLATPEEPDEDEPEQPYVIPFWR